MRRETGFSLIEFMVATAITLLVIGGTLLAFRNAMHSEQNVSLSSDLTENLRAGLNLMQQDLIQAGTGIPTGGIPIPNTPNAAGTCNVGQPMNRPSPAGALTFPACNFVLPAIEPGAGLGPQIASPDTKLGANSDIITFLYADNSLALSQSPITRAAAAGVPACNGTISATGDAVTFDPACINLANAGIRIQPADLILFSNANGNALQTVTNVAGQTLNFAAGDPFNLNGRADPQGTIVQLQNTDPVTGKPTGVYPPTSATRIWMTSYYLDNVTDPQHVRLIRRTNFQAPQPVGETLERLQFTYNFVDGVANPSNQPTVPAGLSENQIRSVNVFLGARSARVNASPERYLRSSLTMQVSLRSMAYVNRYK